MKRAKPRVFHATVVAAKKARFENTKKDNKTATLCKKLERDWHEGKVRQEDSKEVQVIELLQECGRPFGQQMTCASHKSRNRQ